MLPCADPWLSVSDQGQSGSRVLAVARPLRSTLSNVVVVAPAVMSVAVRLNGAKNACSNGGCPLTKNESSVRLQRLVWAWSQWGSIHDGQLDALHVERLFA